jgi:hypothetical protein
LAEAKPAPCQVRSKTGNPCPRRAEVEILGVAFCGPCAHEQEAYFAIGQLTDEEVRDFRNKPLAEALERLRWGHVGRTADISGEMQRGHAGAHGTESLALPYS